MTLEEIFAEINAAGFRVNNLFQNGVVWQCNLISQDLQHYADYATDSSPVVAVQRAFERMLANPKHALDLPPELVNVKPKAVAASAVGVFD